MRYNSILLAALGLECALAQPAHHRHYHKQRRDLADVDWKTDVDWDKVNPDVSAVDFDAVDYGKAFATATAAPVETSTGPSSNVQQYDSPKQAAAPNLVNDIPLPANEVTSAPGIVSNAQGGAHGSFGGRTFHVVTGDRLSYRGNTGIPYGTNMMFVPSIGDQKYTITFNNVGENPFPVIVWNKVGRNGDPHSGSCTEPNLKFTLGAGESQVVAFDENTQGAFSRDCERGPSNQPNCVWGEFDFGDLRPDDPSGRGNKQHSGFDRSSIQGGLDDHLIMTCLNCKGGEQTSARGKNEFTTDAQLSGGGQNNPGESHFLAEFSI
ncbi:MAG: hypothetical protein Q9185_002143 [Variospora sp. 1 TL-2023]